MLDLEAFARRRVVCINSNEPQPTAYQNPRWRKDERMTMPNFFVIGAQKAGTTSLYHYLDQHPDVYMSPAKEPLFFNYDIDPSGRALKRRFGRAGLSRKPRFATLEEYLTLFDGVKDEKAIGEASTLYIYAPGTAERIKYHAPTAKIVAILRNPADRAYSAFLYALRIGVEPTADFGQVLREEERRIRDDWHYVYRYRDRGFYYRQIEAYHRVFGPEKVGVWLYEDLKEDPQGVSRSLFRFLEVDDTFAPDTSSRHNVASVPKNGIARAAIRGMNTAFPLAKKVIPSGSVRVRDSWDYKVRQIVNRRLLTRDPQPLDPELRAELIEDYRDDISRLQELIGRDLSVWLRDKPTLDGEVAGRNGTAPPPNETLRGNRNGTGVGFR